MLGVAPEEVLFVSSNPWDACGAKAFGLKVAWIEREGYRVGKALLRRAHITTSVGTPPDAFAPRRLCPPYGLDCFASLAMTRKTKRAGNSGVSSKSPAR